MKVYRTLLALLGFLLLAGCGDLNAPPPVMHCPQVDMLEQARTLTTFLPGRTDVAARITTAQITGIAGACVTRKKHTELLVTVKVGFEADNGPADNGAPITLPWFVAITRGDHIIQEMDYTSVMKFENGAPQAVATSKVVKIVLPNIPSSGDMQILVSLWLTQDELAYAAAHPNAAP